MPDFTPFDPEKKPDKAGIEKEIAYYERLWGNAHRSMKRADSYFFQTNDIWEDLIEEQRRGRPNLHLATAPGLVNHAVDANLAFEPKWHFTPKGNSKSAEDAANRAEKGWGELFADAVTAGQFFTTKVNGIQLMRHNYTQLHVHLNHDMLDRPVRKDGETQEDFEWRDEQWLAGRQVWNPISIEVPAPGEVLMDPTRKWPQIAIRRRKILALNLADMVVKKAKSRSAEVLDRYTMGETDPYEDIEVVERWSPYWMAMYRKMGKDAGLLWVERNPYGFLPFCHTFGGSADMPMGEPYDPKWFIEQALLFRVMENIKLEAQAVFAEGHIVMRKALAKPIYNGDASDAARLDKSDFLEGKPDDWGLEKVPELAAQTDQYIRTIKDNTEFGTYSLQQAGIREPGTDTATKAMILAEAGSRTFKSSVKQLEGLYSIGGMMGKQCFIVLARDEDYGDSFQVGEYTLKVDDLKQVVRVEAVFEQVDVAVAMQEGAQADQNLKDGLIDFETWARIKRLEDPTGIQDGIIKDSVRKMPEVTLTLQIDALKKLGLMEIAAAKEEELRKARLQRQAIHPSAEGLQREGSLVTPQVQPIGAPSPNGQAPMPQNGAAPYA